MKKYLSFTLIFGVSISNGVVAESAKKEFRVPFKYALGKNLYEKNCSSCHGVTGNGSDKGPPFMHKIYEPSHHGDEAFYRAAINGVKAHHWKFGNMPPVPGIERRDVGKILPYLRWLQRQNGIK